MEGYELIYKPKDDNARTLLNHTLFGRLIYKNYRGRKSVLYVRGLLDKKKFTRLMRAKLFIAGEIDVLLFEDVLGVCGTINITKVDRDDIEPGELKTGEEYWRRNAKEKGLPFKKSQKRRFV